MKRQLDALPAHVVGSFYDWLRPVERDGMRAVRQFSGYHDEKLRGELAGLRSVRLTRAYRVLYFETKEGMTHVAQVTRVSKHDYTK